MRSALQLRGTSAFITGGASGLGLAIAKRFAEEGARVALFDKDSHALSQAQAALPGALCLGGDVTQLSDLKKAVAQAEESFSKVTCVIANAGLWDFMVSLADLPDDDRLETAIDALLAVNVKGYLLTAKAALPALARSGGSLIFTLSNAALYVAGGGPLYTASKHAGVGLVKQLAHELAPRIRVNAVAPGAISTQLKPPPGLVPDGTTIADVPLKDVVPDVVPLAALPEAADYTGPYVLLANPKDSSAMTGAVIEAHGGMGVRGYPKAGGGHDLKDRFAKKGGTGS